MDSKKLKNRFLAYVVGTVTVVVCCFTPILVVVFTGVGLGVFVPYLDFILFPALFVMLIVTFMAYRRWKSKETSSDSEADTL